MKKATFLLTLLSICVTLSAYGQKEKNIVYRVGVGKITYAPSEEDRTSAAGKVLKNVAEVLTTGQSSTREPQYENSVRANVISGLGSVLLFRTFDRYSAVSNPNDTTPLIYLDGTINDLSTTSKINRYKDNKGKVHTTTRYEATVNVTLNLKEADTGTLLNSFRINATGSDFSSMPSRGKAMDNAINNLSTRVATHFNKQFPLYASIVEGGNVKKQKQKEVYIDLGGGRRSIRRTAL